MSSPSTLNIASPALINSTLSALTPFLGLVPGAAPTVPLAAGFLRSDSAAQAIHDRFIEPGGQYAAFAMARFFEQISSPPPAVSDPWMKAIDDWEHSTVESFRDPLTALADVIEQKAADATADQMIASLMAYLENGVEGKRGKVAGDDEGSYYAVLGALAACLPQTPDCNDLHKALAICVNKWVLVCGFWPKNFEALGMDGMQDLYERIIEKYHSLKRLGMNDTLLLLSIHRHSIDTMRHLIENYPMTIVINAIAKCDPRGMASRIHGAYEAALDIARNHPDAAVRKNATTIASTAAHRRIQGKCAGTAFADSVIEAYQAAIKTARAHPDDAIRNNAATIANVAAHRGIQGENAGIAFADSVIESYQTVLKTAQEHPDDGVKKNAATIANQAANRGIQGKDAGIKFADSVIEAYRSALKAARDYPDDSVKKSASTIATAAAHRGIHGKDAGAAFANSVIEAYLAVIDAARGYSDDSIKTSAPAIASYAATEGIRGAEAGRRFVERWAADVIDEDVENDDR